MELQNRGDFLRALDSTLERFASQSSRNLITLARFIEHDMRGRVAVASGATKRSIRTIAGRDSLGRYVDIKVGGAALALEFGTSKMAAQPFVRPAARRGRTAARTILGRKR